MDDSSLRFDIYEQIHLDTKMNGIRLINSTELKPQIKMHLCKDQVKLIGNLLLKINYIGVIPFQTSDLEHCIPVEITIPANIVKDAWLIDADIENFDVDIVGSHAINVTGKLVVYEKESVKVGKVKLPKEVADAIQHLKTHHGGNDTILAGILGSANGSCIITLREYFSVNGIDDLLRALVNGYEIIEEPQVITITPEQKEKAILFYKTQMSHTEANKMHSHNAIHHLLGMLGIEWEELQ